MRRIILLMLPVMLAACALGDVSNPTPAPPLTLMPPPELRFEGDCNYTPSLEMWLQITTRLANDYLQLIKEAAVKNKAEMREAVLTLASLRDTTNQAVTPECAVDAQIILSDAMNTGVTTLQAYINGDRADLGSVVNDVTAQLEQAITIQNELILRMETQIQDALATAAPQ